MSVEIMLVEGGRPVGITGEAAAAPGSTAGGACWLVSLVLLVASPSGASWQRVGDEEVGEDERDDGHKL
eukprot:CAMPEP_0202108778 /NCGR_PEP_ID=MMETSP0965-20130614/21912_1 /ASSEMBLY_ACC=CAM_ASM_000507 /TAXON_ID=4773 /ORGANISM="Schizochytrium aggregatum, Strain ATCC28209" /LENGTH=68 /DNA_ID=CAMNT_0048678053 /DNA_START=17 /DNA_END=221 /DNA_ORIENTATION=+